MSTRIKSIIPTTFLSICLLISQTALANIDQCLELTDMKTVLFEKLDADKALPICKIALEGDRDNNLIKAHYARALIKAKSFKKAFEHSKSAAEAGLPMAQNSLGYLYISGLGVEKNNKKAAHWYHEAAKKRNASAQNGLGIMYLNGLGLKKNNSEAFNWFKKAAEQGHAHAQYSVGSMYAKGQGLKKDNAKAVHWYNKAAEQKYMYAEYELGRHYGYAIGVAKDEKQAFTWYERAAQQGHASAQHNLGNAYSKGLGVEQSHEKAFYWLHEAAKQGGVDAQYLVGKLYAAGQGVAKDKQASLKWLTAAANQNMPIAAYELGSYYFDRRNGEYDPIKASEYYFRAAKGGHKFELAKFFYTKTFKDKDAAGFKNLTRDTSPEWVHKWVSAGCSTIQDKTRKCKNIAVIVVYSNNKQWIRSAVRAKIILEEHGIPAMVIWSKQKNFGDKSEAVVTYVGGYSYENQTGDYATTLIQSADIYPQLTSYKNGKYEYSDWDLRAALADRIGQPGPTWKTSTSKTIHDLPKLMKSAAAIAKKRVK